jgi:hypothetical protein
MFTMYLWRLELPRLRESMEEKRGQKPEASSSLFVTLDHDIKSFKFSFIFSLTDLTDDKEWLPGQDIERDLLELPPNSVKVAIRRKSQLQSTSPTQIDLCSLPTAPSNSPLLVQLINRLDSNKPPGIIINNLGSFFPFIPQRLGHCKALDDAVQCICTAYSALLCSNGSVIGQDRREYYQALRSLRLACQDKNDVLSSNVLCAAVLLSWYEVSRPPTSSRERILNCDRYWLITSTIPG